MKIYFLGTSHGVPEPNRGCSCTMVEVQGKYYVIDIGVMLFEKLATLGIDINDVKAVFCTHMHGDHTNGLISFVDLLSWYYKTAEPEIHLPDTQCVSVIRDWIDCSFSQPMRDLPFKKIEAGVIFDDGVVKITAIPTMHCKLSYAFLVEAEGKSVLFTGDIRRPTIDFPQVALEREMDLIVAEAAHFPVETYLEVLQGKAKSILINHYSPKMINCFMDFKKAMDPIPVRLATDGMIYSL